MVDFILLWEQRVAGSNPVTPTVENQGVIIWNDSFFCILEYNILPFLPVFTRFFVHLFANSLQKIGEKYDNRKNLPRYKISKERRVFPRENLR